MHFLFFSYIVIQPQDFNLNYDLLNFPLQLLMVFEFFLANRLHCVNCSVENYNDESTSKRNSNVDIYI